MQSKKRFTETNIWESAWFMNLDSKQKLFWYYLNDRCDNVGVWDPNFKLALFHIEITGSVDDFVQSFLSVVNQNKQKVKVLGSGSWFIIDFVRFQYCQKKSLHINNPAHKSYIQLMRQRGLWEYFCNDQPEVMPYEELEAYEEFNIKPAL